MTIIRKQDPLFKIASGSLYDLPTPSNIHFMWNLGSLLGVCLTIQIVSGLFLTMHYSSSIEGAFAGVNHIMRDVNLGWLVRVLHANGASAFFICLYMHIGRGIYFNSYRLEKTWMSGVTLLLLVMATAFLGYVLPWGQMSFWGATVITNLFSAIPVLGDSIVSWLWGSFSVGAPALTRFYSFHFLLPFLVLGVVVLHLFFLHEKGSNNPLGVASNWDKVKFHPFYSWKDLLGVFLFSSGGLFIVFELPWILGDPDNFIPANPMVTPTHIKPEWYFLFAYAILRAIPNKLGGVVSLAFSVMVLYLLPFWPQTKLSGQKYYFFAKTCFFWWLAVLISLTWIGGCSVEAPFEVIGRVSSVLYFSFFLVFPLMMYTQDFYLSKY